MTTLFEQEMPADVVVLDFTELSDAEEPVEESAAPDVEEQQSAATVREREWQRQLAEECEQALEQGRTESEARYREGLEIERSAVALACASFGRARERYFAEVEAEVVKLSLAIAARVLQREVAMDPVVLAGVVRVALDKLSDREGAVLHVPAKEAKLWRKAMKSAGVRMEADEALEAGELLLKTAAGAAELGIEAQLVEIERGFMDLLAKRPA